MQKKILQNCYCTRQASQVVTKIQIDLDGEIRKINSKNYDQKYTDTKQKYYKYQKKLEVKRSKN